MSFKPDVSRVFDPADPPAMGEWVQISPAIERPTVRMYPERRPAVPWLAAGGVILLLLLAIVFWPRGSEEPRGNAPPKSSSAERPSTPPPQPPPTESPAAARLVLNWAGFVEAGGIVKGSVLVTPGEAYRVAVTENGGNSLVVDSTTSGTAAIDWKYFFRNQNEHELREIAGRQNRLHPKTTYFPLTIRGANRDSEGKLSVTLSARIYSVEKREVEIVTLTASEGLAD
jgi:hypothetical protein